MIRFVRLSRFAALTAAATLIAVQLPALAAAAPVASKAPTAAPTATLTLNKTALDAATGLPLTGPITPGQGFTYQLSAQCSGLTQGCINAKTVDVIPAGVNITVPPSTALYDVAYVAATRTLTITYKDKLLSPPNPAGSVGIFAGSNRVAQISATLDPNTTALDGSTITNTGDATADNTEPSSDSAPITVSIPRKVTPVATKTFSDPSLVATSGDTTRVTLGVRNASSSSAAVSALTVADTSKATWDDFDLVSVGPTVTLPPGADQVSVQYCTSPAPCTSFTAGPFVPGPAIALPDGVDPATVTGVQFVFKNSTGTTLPVSSTAASVPIDLKLRDTVRSSGLPLNPTTPLTQANCASPSGTDPVLGTVAGGDACANFTIQPGSASLGMSKAFFPDAGGTFSSNGTAVAGQNSPVTAVSTAQNTSAFPVPNLTIVEPSTLAPNDFADVDTSNLRLVFPTGATKAVVTVTCRSGANPVPVTVTPPPTTANLASTGCAAGIAPASVAVTYTGTIAAKASAQLGVHGTLNASAAAGTVRNCVDGALDAGAQGSAAGLGCANLTVLAPVGTVSGTKTVSNGSTGGQLVPGQPLTFNLSATNTGNIPQSAFTLEDPDPDAGNPNPFTVVRLTSATLATTPAALAASMRIEVLDGADWVPYVGTDAALLTRATGIRATLIGGTAPPNAKVNLNFAVLERDGQPAGAGILNCQKTFVSSTLGTTDSGSKCAPRLVSAPPAASGAVNKSIVPPSVARTIPGVPAQKAQVRLQGQNNGNIPMNRIVITDADAGFFDAADLVSLDGVNFPPGSNQVQVDACTSAADCSAGTFTAGSPGATPALPAGVSPATVQGLRFTFTNSAGGYVLVPGANLPAGGACPNATACFTVSPRSALRSDPAGTVPDALNDTATAGGESPLTPGALQSFGNASAALGITAGTTRLAVTKTPTSSAAGPGDPIPFTLSTTNTGTGAVPGLVVTEPLPAGLVLDDSFSGPGGVPYTLTVTVPAGTPAAPDPVFDAVRDPVTNQITKLTWTFPSDFAFLPTSTASFGVQAKLAPGAAAGQQLVNTVGVSSTDPTIKGTLACDGTSVVDNATYGPGRFCTAAATVTTRAGSAVDAQKWVHGDDSRGFYNTASKTFVPIGDSSCPLLVAHGVNYTRFPCIALVLAGQNFDFLINIVNAGTTPATSIRLADGLPEIGDTGVKLTNQQRGTEWDPRPTLAAAPSLITGPGSATFSYAADSPVCTKELTSPPGTCPAGDWEPTFSTAAKGFKAVLDFPDQLKPAQTVQILIPMSAPTDLDVTGNPLPIAWNSFAHTDFMLQNGNPVQLPLVEPIKVGIGMPFDKLSITKTVTGPIPAGSLIGPFQAAYQCTVTPATGDPVIAAQGTGTFSQDTPLDVPQVPVGSVCKVWETDTGGGLSDHTSLDTALTVPITDDTADGTVFANLVNDFPAPRLILTKSVTGDASGYDLGPFVLAVDCTLAGTEVTGYPRNLTFDGAGSQSITDLPIGSLCTVSEPDTRGATETSTAYSDGDHAQIRATVDATASVTNTYAEQQLTVSKTVVGPGSAGPYSFHASCTLTSNLGAVISVPLGDKADFSLSAGEQRVIGVPKGSVCSVTEQDVPDFDTVSYNGDPQSPALDLTGDSTLDVVNTFSAPLVISKTVDGAAATYATGPFTLTVDCAVDGEPVTGFPQDITVAAGGSSSIQHLPIGAACTVAEPDSRGATSTQITYSGDGSSAVIGPTSTTAAVSNTYDAANLTVTKKVVGPGSAGPYTFGASCTLTSNAGTVLPVPLAAVDRTFALSANESRTIGVPKGAVCSVVEDKLPKGDTASYDGAADSPALIMDADRTLAIVNTFQSPPPTTTASTSIGDTGGTGGPTTTPASGVGGTSTSITGTSGTANGGGGNPGGGAGNPGGGPGAGSQQAAGGQSLPNTGVPVARDLWIAALLLFAGGVMLVVGRRHRQQAQHGRRGR